MNWSYCSMNRMLIEAPRRWYHTPSFQFQYKVGKCIKTKLYRWRLNIRFILLNHFCPRCFSFILVLWRWRLDVVHYRWWDEVLITYFLALALFVHASPINTSLFSCFNYNFATVKQVHKLFTWDLQICLQILCAKGLINSRAIGNNH